MEEQRKLAAILFSDIVGFSKIMGEDEESGLQLLEKHDEILTPVIADHQGTILKKMGDAIFAEFISAVRAVECAIEIQKALVDYNRDKAKSEKIIIRIGIHLGDVVIKGNDLFGDGVNVASRLEPLAEPGGICISGAVYQAIASRTDISTRNLGVQELKNIVRDHTIYKVYHDQEQWKKEAYLDKRAETLVTTRRRYQIIRGAAIALAVTLMVVVGTLIFRTQRDTGTKFFMFDFSSSNVGQDTLALLTAGVYGRMVQNPRLAVLTTGRARKLATRAGLLLESPISSTVDLMRKSELNSYLSQLGRALGCDQIAHVILDWAAERVSWTVITYDVHDDRLFSHHNSITEETALRHIAGFESIANAVALGIISRVLSPLTGTIVQEGKKEVLIDVGAKDGVVPGMTFHVVRMVPIDEELFGELFALARTHPDADDEKVTLLCTLCGQPLEFLDAGEIATFDEAQRFDLNYFCTYCNIEVNMKAAGEGAMNVTVGILAVEEINPRSTLCKVILTWKTPLPESTPQILATQFSNPPKVGDRVQQRL